MRSFSFAVSLIVGGIALFASAPAFAVCNPSNTTEVSCLKAADRSCSQLGTSMMDKDQKNIIACLRNNSGTLEWKAMTSGGASWTSVDLSDGVTPFKKACEYKIEFSDPGHNVYSPYTDSNAGTTVSFAQGVGPLGDLIGTAHSGVISGILHTNKTTWAWVSGSSQWWSLPNSVKAIYERCP